MDRIKQYTKNIVAWNGQWTQICQELKEYGEYTPKFEDVLSTTRSSFGKVLKQGVFDNLNLISAPSISIKKLYRFVKEDNINAITASRFIPQPEYASLNRMNDKDRLYSYFSIGYKDSTDSDIIATGVREIRSKSWDNIWRCQFNFPKNIDDLKIVDFSAECKIPKSEEDYHDFLLRKIKKGFRIDEEQLTYWLLQTLLQIFHDSDMFAPIDKNEPDMMQRLKYKPFHVICDFLERKGYHGMIYRSTVFKKGRCLVLFNPSYAECLFNTVEKVDVDKALRIQ